MNKIHIIALNNAERHFLAKTPTSIPNRKNPVLIMMFQMQCHAAWSEGDHSEEFHKFTNGNASINLSMQMNRLIQSSIKMVKLKKCENGIMEIKGHLIHETESDHSNISMHSNLIDNEIDEITKLINNAGGFTIDMDSSKIIPFTDTELAHAKSLAMENNIIPSSVYIHNATLYMANHANEDKPKTNFHIGTRCDIIPEIPNFMIEEYPFTKITMEDLNVEIDMSVEITRSAQNPKYSKNKKLACWISIINIDDSSDTYKVPDIAMIVLESIVKKKGIVFDFKLNNVRFMNKSERHDFKNEMRLMKMKQLSKDGESA